MPLIPKRTKYRKQQKGRNRGKATRGNRVTDGVYGLQAVEAGSNHIKSNRSSPCCYDTLYQKRWKSLDKNISRQTNNTENL